MNIFCNNYFWLLGKPSKAHLHWCLCGLKAKVKQSSFNSTFIFTKWDVTGSDSPAGFELELCFHLAQQFFIGCFRRLKQESTLTVFCSGTISSCAERPHLTLCLWTPQLIKLLICSRSAGSDHQRISSTWHSGNFEKECLLSVSLKSTESTVHVEARWGWRRWSW